MGWYLQRIQPPKKSHPEWVARWLLQRWGGNHEKELADFGDASPAPAPKSILDLERDVVITPVIRIAWRRFCLVLAGFSWLALTPAA